MRKRSRPSRPGVFLHEAGLLSAGDRASLSATQRTIAASVKIDNALPFRHACCGSLSHWTDTSFQSCRQGLQFDAIGDIGHLYLAQHDLPKAITAFTQSLELFEKVPLDVKCQGDCV